MSVATTKYQRRSMADDDFSDRHAALPRVFEPISRLAGSSRNWRYGCSALSYALDETRRNVADRDPPNEDSVDRRSATPTVSVAVTLYRACNHDPGRAGIRSLVNTVRYCAAQATGAAGRSARGASPPRRSVRRSPRPARRGRRRARGGVAVAQSAPGHVIPAVAADAHARRPQLAQLGGARLAGSSSRPARAKNVAVSPRSGGPEERSRHPRRCRHRNSAEHPNDRRPRPAARRKESVTQ